MGEGTLKVPMALHKLNRTRLFERFSDTKEGVILFQGGKQRLRDQTDHEELFRQESFFQWVFGVHHPDCYGALDLATQEAILFIPRLPESYAIWMGEIAPPEHYQKYYEVDHVRFVDDLPAFLEEKASSQVFLLEGLNTDSGLRVKPAKVAGVEMKSDRFDYTKLYREICDLRSIKTPYEQELLKYVARVSSEAHVACMRHIKPGMKEYQLEAVFLHHVYYHGGCRHPSYTCICAAGTNAAVLHYGHAGAPNDTVIKDDAICLFDMGAEYHCYSADITCSFPVNGKFNEKQRDVYTAVLNAQNAVFEKLKPGASWKDMHLTAERAILGTMLERGYLQGDLEEMVTNRIGALFMPHGLGHMLGIDTHDVGGYLDFHPPRPTEAGLRSLRTAVILKEGMYLTVEPGLYFIAALLNPAFEDPEKSKYLVVDKLKSMIGFGGVRLEDDILITADGFENYTRCPRTIEDIEAVMAGADWDFDKLSVV